MYQITCENCDETNQFENLSEKPVTCSNCNYPLDDVEAREVVADAATEADELEAKHAAPAPSGITLVYQNTGENIEIRQNRAVLGREGFGAKVLQAIPQISRSHCVIERIDDQYRITDLDSYNGTYVGVAKIDCKVNPRQVLEQDEIVFLGQEPFLVKLQFKNDSDSARTEVPGIVSGGSGASAPAMDSEKQVIVYRCTCCGRDYERLEEIHEEVCRNCGTYSEYVKIGKKRQ